MSRQRHFAMIPCDIHQWSGWTDMTIEEQWLYYLLRRQEKVNAAGILELHISRWAAECGNAGRDVILRVLDDLATKGYVVVDFEQEELLLCWYITTDNIYKKPNPLTAAVNAIREVRSSGIKTALHNELKALDEANIAPLESVPTIRWLISHLEPHALIGTKQPLHNPSTSPVLPVNRSKVRAVQELGDAVPDGPVVVVDAEPADDEPAQTPAKTGQNNRSARVVRRGTEVKEQRETLPTPDGVGAQARPMNAGSIVKDWIDSCATRPPEAIVGQVAKRVGAMLGQGLPPEKVRAGVLAWQAHGQCAPTVVESFVHQVMNGGNGGRPAGNGQDGRFAPGSGPRLARGTSTKIDI